MRDFYFCVSIVGPDYCNRVPRNSAKHPPDVGVTFDRDLPVCVGFGFVHLMERWNCGGVIRLLSLISSRSLAISRNNSITAVVELFFVFFLLFPVKTRNERLVCTCCMHPVYSL